MPKKPKKAKSVRAWGAIHIQTGKLLPEAYRSKHIAQCCYDNDYPQDGPYYKYVRVEIREVRGK